ncbi:MAG: type II secretion system protein GspF [Proteobacteria bacterium]|nr:MAG: type II secretion system protein GspF [Pseudomonadota bacterium]
MPVFEYSALNERGKASKGTIDAENIRVARQKLRSQGIYPTDVKEGMAARQAPSRDIKRYFQSDRVALKDLALATRQLATLSAAGLPLVNALSALADQTETTVLKRIVVDVREKVEEGSSLAKAMGNFPKSFPKLYVNMIASGEASGTLDAVLANLADYLESQLQLRRQVTSALLYPILMLAICTLVVVALLVFVVPRIVEIFIKQGATLPLPTRIMIGVSDFVIQAWYLVIVLVIGVLYLLRWYYSQDEGRKRIDRWMLKAPLYGPLFVKVCTARISRTLGALLASGVGLLTGIDITKNIVSNVHVVKALEDARDGVREGRSLAKELSKSGIFPAMMWHMIAVGEKSGELEDMLTKAGKAYENEVSTTLSGLTKLIEPLMMIGVGVVVLCIVISVLMPMADLIEVVQG